MAVGLRFTDGTTTVTVSNGTTGYLERYQQNNQPAEVEKVTDKAGFVLLGTLANVRSTVQSLNRLFWQAINRRNTGMGPRVFVERDLGDSVWWRSEIYEASLINVSETLDTGLAGEKIPFDCMINRYNWWEGAEASVPLSNANGTDVTTGLTIYNHDDTGTGHDNWVSIDGVNDVVGDLPAPTILTIEQYTSGTSTIYGVYIGQNWTETSFSHILEAEDGIGTTDTADSNCSKGYRVDKAVSAGTESLLVYWRITPTYYYGNYYKPILRVQDVTDIDKMRFRFKIFDQLITNPIYTSGYVQSTGVHLFELPTLRLPPYLFNTALQKPIDLYLYGKNTHTSSVTVQLDFVQVTPLDGYRYISLLGGMYTGEKLIDDGIENITRIYHAANYNSAPLVAYGESIKLRPGVNQKLYFLTRFSDISSIGYLHKIYVSYRPRRLTI